MNVPPIRVNLETARDLIDAALWRNHWHLFAHRSELARGGDFVRRTVGMAEVAAFNDGADVVAFDNRCPHRGARIYDGHGGNKRFVCAYHGWSYIKGRMFAPARDSFASTDPTTAELNRYQIEWLGDFLFVALAPEQALSQQLAGVADTVAALSHNIDRQLDFNGYHYHCNWRLAVENALDQYHVSLVHAQTLNRLQLEPAHDEHFGRNNISTAPLGDEKLKRRLRSFGRFFDIGYRSEDYTAIYLFPFTFLTSTFSYSFSLQQFYPSASRDTCHFSSRFYASRLNTSVRPASLDTFFNSAIAVNHAVFTEDAEVCARLPTDGWTSDPLHYPSAGEAKIVQFRDQMRLYEAEHGKPETLPRGIGL